MERKCAVQTMHSCAGWFLWLFDNLATGSLYSSGGNIGARFLPCVIFDNVHIDVGQLSVWRHFGGFSGMVRLLCSTFTFSRQSIV